MKFRGQLSIICTCFEKIFNGIAKEVPSLQGGDEFRTGYTHFSSFKMRDTLTHLWMGRIHRRVRFTNFGDSLLLNIWVPL